MCFAYDRDWDTNLHAKSLNMKDSLFVADTHTCERYQVMSAFIPYHYLYHDSQFQQD